MGLVESVLGPVRYDGKDLANRLAVPGVVAGLAWTPSGGEMMFVECALVSPGKGRVTLTGTLGEVLKESAQIALSWVRRHTKALKVRPLCDQLYPLCDQLTPP